MTKEGICVGIADGKVVVEDKDINIVMDTLIQDYSDKKTSITSIPKGDKVFIL
jgi:dihydroxyacetone kinase-like predicted kinase